jgi:hypothetical protein
VSQCPSQADSTLEEQVEDKVASAPLYVVYADQKTAANDDVDDSVELAPEEQDVSAEVPIASKLTEVPIA